MHYPLAPFQQPVYAGSPVARDAEHPRAAQAAAEVISLPLFPEMEEGDVARVVEAIGRFEGETSAQGREGAARA